MDDNVRKFPIPASQRTINRRGKRTLNCVVSSRYIKYDQPDKVLLQEGRPIYWSIMVDNYGDKPDRKLCEFIVTYEELKVMMARFEGEIEELEE